MKNRLLTYITASTLGLAMISCSEDDNTGHSKLVPTNPTISVTVASSVTVMDDVDTSIPVSVTMSEAQIVDVNVFVSQVSGSATEGEDFKISNIVIPAGDTDASTTIEILGDTSPEDLEDLVIQIGDDLTANAQITPVQTSIEITNYASADLVLGLDWEIAAYGSDGELLDPHDVVDPRWLYTDYPVTTILGGSDGGSAEEFTISGDLADGVYGLYIDFFAIGVDLGDNDVDIKFTMTAEQEGVFSSSYNIEGVLDTSDDSAAATVATLTKSGSTYTIELL